MTFKQKVKKQIVYVMNSSFNEDMSTYKSIKPNNEDYNSWGMIEELKPKYVVNSISLVNATNIVSLRNECVNKQILPPSYTSIILKSVAITIKKNPILNRAILGPKFLKRIVQFNHTDINVAVEKSLPNIPGQAYSEPIRSVEDLSVFELTRKLHALSMDTKASNKNLDLYFKILKWMPFPLGSLAVKIAHLHPYFWKKYRGSAVWVNSPTKSGSDLTVTTWPWPVSFSFGFVKKRPFVVNNKVEATYTIPLVMCFDRRLLGGGPGNRIFEDFKNTVENFTIDQIDYAKEITIESAIHESNLVNIK